MFHVEHYVKLRAEAGERARNRQGPNMRPIQATPSQKRQTGAGSTPIGPEKTKALRPA